MIEIDKIFKFEVLTYYMVTLTLKSKVHKFACVIVLSLLTKLSDLGASWFLGPNWRATRLSRIPPTQHKDPPKYFFIIYKQTQFGGFREILEKHMQHGLANWFLAVASGLPPYLKGRGENTRPTSSQWNCTDMVVWEMLDMK